LEAVDKALIDNVNVEIKEYIQHMDKLKLRDGLKTIMAISSLGNKYTQENQPWALIKSNAARCGTVLYLTSNLVKNLVALLEPFMPSLADKILSQLNSTHDPIPSSFEFLLKSGHVLGDPEPLIGTLELARINELKGRFGGEKKPVFPAEIRVGKIVSVADHPEADHLYVLQVSLGKETRQVVSGLKGSYQDKSTLENKSVLVLSNLKESKFKGVASQGMVLVADDGKQVELLTVDAAPGSVVLPEGTTLQAQPKYSARDFTKLDLQIVEAKVVMEGKLLQADGKPVHPDGTLTTAKVK